tara:strand:- start:818 stop:1684 length:867 start_codon:yes stop_codon:yes gene_type:complete
MKGIVLAGGSGKRLSPVTKGVSKHLIPIFDKPMIYYPISVLMMAGIREILIISTPEDFNSYKKLLGDGSKFGIKFEYKQQANPDGLAQAFIIGEKFIGTDPVCLILGDNIFYGHELNVLIKEAIEDPKKATVFGYPVKDPQRYGVIEFNKEGEVLSIEEKPNKPRSNKAVVGLYFYPNDVIEISKKVKRSQRGEFEITSINQAYLEKKNLQVKVLGRGFAWLDTGTHESLLEAGQFVHTLEKRQGLKIACLEEIAYNNKWISNKELLKQTEELSQTEYGQYLIQRYLI